MKKVFCRVPDWREHLRRKEICARTVHITGEVRHVRLHQCRNLDLPSRLLFLYPLSKSGFVDRCSEDDTSRIPPLGHGVGLTGSTYPIASIRFGIITRNRFTCFQIEPTIYPTIPKLLRVGSRHFLKVDNFPPRAT